MSRCRRSERLGGEQVERTVGEGRATASSAVPSSDASRRACAANVSTRTPSTMPANLLEAVGDFHRGESKRARSWSANASNIGWFRATARSTAVRACSTAAVTSPRAASAHAVARCRRRRCCRGSSCSRLRGAARPRPRPRHRRARHAMARYADIGRAYPRSSEPISTVPSRTCSTAWRGRPRTKAITPRTRHQPTRAGSRPGPSRSRNLAIGGRLGLPAHRREQCRRVPRHLELQRYKPVAPPTERTRGVGDFVDHPHRGPSRPAARLFERRGSAGSGDAAVISRTSFGATGSVPPINASVPTSTSRTERLRRGQGHPAARCGRRLAGRADREHLRLARRDVAAKCIGSGQSACSLEDVEGLVGSALPRQDAGQQLGRFQVESRLECRARERSAMAWSQAAAPARRSTDGLGPAAIAGLEAPQRHAELVPVGDVSARFHRVGEAQPQLIQAPRRHAPRSTSPNSGCASHVRGRSSCSSGYDATRRGRVARVAGRTRPHRAPGGIRP